jgi:hypothetical protein
MPRCGMTLRWFCVGYVAIPEDGKRSSVTASQKFRHIRHRHSGDFALGKTTQRTIYLGVNADRLNGLDTWWGGPVWFSQDLECWPRNAGTSEKSPLEERKTLCPVLHIRTTETLLDPSRYNSYWRLLRVTAWIFRFTRNVRRAHLSSGELTATELTKARLHWIQAVQTEYFAAELDALQSNMDLLRDSKIARFNPHLEDGLLRLGGRLQCAELSEDLRHPILLDGKHHFVHLLIWQMHIRLHHLGVRRRILDIACTSSH